MKMSGGGYMNIIEIKQTKTFISVFIEENKYIIEYIIKNNPITNTKYWLRKDLNIHDLYSVCESKQKELDILYAYYRIEHGLL